MTTKQEKLAQKIQAQIVGVEHWTEDNHVAVIERVNSNHPDMEIGLFVDYKNTARNEWITPDELERRLNSGEWEVREDGN